MSRQELRSTGGNCQGDDRQESCSSAGNFQADELAGGSQDLTSMVPRELSPVSSSLSLQFCPCKIHSHSTALPPSHSTLPCLPLTNHPCLENSFSPFCLGDRSHNNFCVPGANRRAGCGHVNLRSPCHSPTPRFMPRSPASSPGHSPCCADLTLSMGSLCCAWVS